MPRDELYLAQTPQGFKKGLITRAYQSARHKGLIATDDASLVEALGYPVKIVRGSYENIKITTPMDIKQLMTNDECLKNDE
jgi:2-C-methyl-D-erythritol 4-phosphate cytidylyltransferase